jgi:hypothetical protein
MIRSSIHRSNTFLGLSAGVAMRTGTSWNAVLCLELEGTNYQPKQDRLRDFEIVI